MNEYRWKAYLHSGKHKQVSNELYGRQIHQTMAGLEQDRDPEQRRRAARNIATAAINAAECAMFLDMLGISPAEGKNDAGREGEPGD